eukprot:c35070_g1_i1 orf=109-1419(+)
MQALCIITSILADFKDLIFLLASLHLAVGAFDLPCRDFSTRRNHGLEDKIWSLTIWGAVSVALATAILFPSLQSWSPAEAITSPEFNAIHIARGKLAEASSIPSLSSITSRFSSLPSFKEAPSFRNEKKCLSRTGNTSEWEFVCDPASVHIAMALDEPYLRGSIAAILSILRHASCPENVVFHFLVSDRYYQFQSLIRSTFPYLKFKIYNFDQNLVKDRISSSVRQALEQPLNYARTYLAEILEVCVGRVIYLDSDLVVVDDIAKLWDTSLGSNALGAPEYCHANFTKYFTPSFWSNRSLARTFDGRNPCYFNTGVMIMDLMKWRQKKYTKMIELWMGIQKERRIYELGSLPPFLLVFAGSVEPVEHRWNQHGLGGDNVKGSCRPLHAGAVSLLHWSGNGKPWLRLDSGQSCPVDSLWSPYDLYVTSSNSENLAVE